MSKIPNTKHFQDPVQWSISPTPSPSNEKYLPVFFINKKKKIIVYRNTLCSDAPYPYSIYSDMLCPYSIKRRAMPIWYTDTSCPYSIEIYHVLVVHRGAQCPYSIQRHHVIIYSHSMPLQYKDSPCPHSLQRHSLSLSNKKSLNVPEDRDRQCPHLTCNFRKHQHFFPEHEILCWNIKQWKGSTKFLIKHTNTTFKLT